MAGRGGRKAGPCWEDRRQPLCAGLAGRGAPDAHNAPDIPEQDLPQDEQGRLLRPGVVWFNEALDPSVLQAAEAATTSCDLFITAGTSAVVYPAAGGRPFRWCGAGSAVLRCRQRGLWVNPGGSVGRLLLGSACGADCRHAQAIAVLCAHSPLSCIPLHCRLRTDGSSTRGGRG